MARARMEAVKMAQGISSPRTTNNAVWRAGFGDLYNLTVFFYLIPNPFTSSFPSSFPSQVYHVKLFKLPNRTEAYNTVISIGIKETLIDVVKRMCFSTLR